MHKKQIRTKKEVQNRKQSVIAGTLALTLLIGGTFAWQSFGQTAKNETILITDVYGARLHDDFDGANKDIYVENYVHENQGGGSVFARVRLDEYMEYGTGAGIRPDLESESEFHEERDPDMVVVEGDMLRTDYHEDVVIEDRDTWYTHIFQDGYEVDSYTEPVSYENEEDNLRTYIELVFGDEDGVNYMPTFNKDTTSLESDINGALEGLDGNRLDGEAYDDYILWEDEDMETGAEIYHVDGGIEIPDGAVQDVSNPDIYILSNQVHEVSKTPGSTVISMAEWEEKPMSQRIGNFWVYDTDGWAYWAAPIDPITDEETFSTTGLLLNHVETISSPAGKQAYYAINVVAQMCSPGDWGSVQDENGDGGEGIYGDIQDSGLKLLELISGNLEAYIELKDETGADFASSVLDMYWEDSATYAAYVSIPSATAAEETVSWILTDESGAQLDTTGILTEAVGVTYDLSAWSANKVVFTPTQAMAGKVYTIRAECDLNKNKYGAVKVNVFDIIGEKAPAFSIYADGVKVEDYANDISADAGSSIRFTGSIQDLSNQSITWNIESGATGDTSIDAQTGVLSIGEQQAAESKIVIRATSAVSDSLYQDITVTITYDPLAALSAITVGSDDYTELAGE